MRDHELRKKAVGEMHLRRWPVLEVPCVIVQWVLIVDDDPAIASVIAARFESQGVIVRVAHTLKEASDLWAERTPAIVVIDGWFGDTTSETWIGDKAASEPEVQWVICTADPRVRPANARWIIEKPFNRSDLDECAAKVITTCALRSIELDQQTHSVR